MPAGLLVSLTALSALFAFYYREASRHDRCLRRIPLRVLVNGTRGKSGVTRLIAAGLRAGGLTVVAKTTGTEPRIIMPDGSERPMGRRGPANIKEIIGVVELAAAENADALVVECMAIRPELQWFCEHRLVRSHIGVITNVRADHQEVMGSELADIALALANTIPAAGSLVTTPAAAALLKTACPDKAARFLTAGGAQLDAALLGGFPYEVIGDNVALALAVCRQAGVGESAAIAGMRGAAPDPGNVTVERWAHRGLTVTFINALAANDAESTTYLWQRYVAGDERNVAVLLNCRADRKYRTVKLCEALARFHKGAYILAGDAGFARANLLRNGVARDSLRELPAGADRRVLGEIAGRLAEERLTIFAAGNSKGLGQIVPAGTGG
jgi:poly-gamma-glutamate synthase PgsB/CapB